MTYNQVSISALGIALCSFHTYKKLRELDISFCKLGSKGVKMLNESIKLNIGINIHKLNLEGN